MSVFSTEVSRLLSSRLDSLLSELLEENRISASGDAMFANFVRRAANCGVCVGGTFPQTSSSRQLRLRKDRVFGGVDVVYAEPAGSDAGCVNFQELSTNFFNWLAEELLKLFPIRVAQPGSRYFRLLPKSCWTLRQRGKAQLLASGVSSGRFWMVCPRGCTADAIDLAVVFLLDAFDDMLTDDE